jgi:hypothetical protein
MTVVAQNRLGGEEAELEEPHPLLAGMVWTNFITINIVVVVLLTLTDIIVVVFFFPSIFVIFFGFFCHFYHYSFYFCFSHN